MTNPVRCHETNFRITHYHGGVLYVDEVYSDDLFTAVYRRHENMMALVLFNNMAKFSEYHIMTFGEDFWYD